MRSATVPSAAIAGVLLLAGCTGSAAGGGGGDAVAAVSPVTATPSAASTLVADTDPAASAVSTSRALFSSSPVVVVAGVDDEAGQLLAASAAVALGVPLLLSSGSADDPAVGELDRLGAQDVLAVGDTGLAESPGWDVVTVPATAGAVQDATGIELGEAQTVDSGAEVAAVAGLQDEGTAELRPDGASGSSASSGSTESSADSADEAGELPPVDRADPLTDVVVLASGSGESLAGVATARAAGATVQLTDGQTDPRASADVVDALAAAKPAAVLALGADFAGVQGLDWKTATAATGSQLPGGGQLLFPEHFFVGLYGYPDGGALGVLGEQPLEQSIARAEQTAAPYESLLPDKTVVPMFEVIATVASASAGPDGNYSTEADVESLRTYVETAGAAGLYVVLDLQPGRTDFLTQAQLYQSLLELPYVGLALDPEWRLKPNQVHLTQIGQVGIDEVNSVVSWLADLTRANALPQKLLVLHQFQVRMITERERLDTSRDELAILVNVDGQGGQAAKQDTWNVLHQDAPAPLYWGWKNFYDEDQPMLTPEQTIAQVMPTPQIVTYQ